MVESATANSGGLQVQLIRGRKLSQIILKKKSFYNSLDCKLPSSQAKRGNAF